MAAEESDGARPLYTVLGVPADASADAIKKAYRRLALEHHPDKRQSAGDGAEQATETFARLAFAYEVLGDAQRRKRYDLTGEVPQTDAALGKAAGETFLAAYIQSAPRTARGVTQADMSLHSLDNYEILDVHGKDVPEYMRGIVMIGLGYLSSVVEGMEDKEVVLLRHFVMDQMYALLSYEPPLDSKAFQERGYAITYYDHPLQPGIRAVWSDQNRLDGSMASRDAGRAELRTIDAATVERRQLAALEWHGGHAVVGASAAAPAPAAVPGEGFGAERIQLGARALLTAGKDLMSYDVHRLRRELEEVLGLEAHALDEIGGTSLMGCVLSACDEDEDDVDDKEPELGVPAPEPAPAQAMAAAAAPGSAARVRATGRFGEVLQHDPDDPDLTFKLRFTDGAAPAEDWFGHSAVELLSARG